LIVGADVLGRPWLQSKDESSSIAFLEIIMNYEL